MSDPTLTLAELLDRAQAGTLPPTMPTSQAAPLIGCSTDHLYELVRDGDPPIEPLRLGRKLVWPTLPLLRLLGIEPRPPDA